MLTDTRLNVSVSSWIMESVGNLKRMERQPEREMEWAEGESSDVLFRKNGNDVSVERANGQMAWQASSFRKRDKSLFNVRWIL